MYCYVTKLNKYSRYNKITKKKNYIYVKILQMVDCIESPIVAYSHPPFSIRVKYLQNYIQTTNQQKFKVFHHCSSRLSGKVNLFTWFK